MLNSVKARKKFSNLEVKMGMQIKIVFIVQLLCCVFGSLYHAIYSEKNWDQLYYLEFASDSSMDSFTMNMLVRYGNWLLIFTNFVPISLLVTLEMVKFAQGYFISVDRKMKTKSKNDEIYASVQSSNLNEELGQIQYIFSDKTGTLTKNLMEFKKCSVGGKSYGDPSSRKNDSSTVKQMEYVDFDDFEFNSDVKEASNENHLQVVLGFTYIREFLLCLSLCHSIIVEEKEGKTTYNASSPDELALINFAKSNGYIYKGMNENNEMIVENANEEATLSYKLLYSLEFNSTRFDNH